MAVLKVMQHLAQNAKNVAFCCILLHRVAWATTQGEAPSTSSGQVALQRLSALGAALDPP